MTTYPSTNNTPERPPNLFLVGAPKCGTTAMCHYLSLHPDIFAPVRKEFHHLCPDLSYHHRVDTRAEYLAHYKEWSTEKWAIDGSVFYLYSRVAARKIHSLSPDCRILIMLRNPIDVLYALHKQWVFNGYENLTDFEEALAAEPMRRSGLNMPKKSVFPWGLIYRDVCGFTEQILRYFKVFGRDKVHVVVYDDFVRDTEAVYCETLRFLELKEHTLPAFEKINSVPEFRSHAVMRMIRRPSNLVQSTVGKVLPESMVKAVRRLHDRYNAVHRPPRMSAAFYGQLQEEFRGEISTIGALLGRDLAFWVNKDDRLV